MKFCNFSQRYFNFSSFRDLGGLSKLRLKNPDHLRKELFEKIRRNRIKLNTMGSMQKTWNKFSPRLLNCGATDISCLLPFGLVFELQFNLVSRYNPEWGYIKIMGIILVINNRQLTWWMPMFHSSSSHQLSCIVFNTNVKRKAYKLSSTPGSSKKRRRKRKELCACCWRMSTETQRNRFNIIRWTCLPLNLRIYRGHK